MVIDETLIQDLPVREIVPRVGELLGQHNRLVVTAAPGAGKSTLLPLAILQQLPPEGRILMLEPRRLAAKQIAERMAQLIHEDVGQTVGYRIRFDTRVSASTRIEVLTEGILTRMLVEDSTLEGVSVVIFDEFHERSLASDLALALALESQQVVRDDLRIVLMSATIATDELCRALDAPLVQSEGRMFPVEVVHWPRESNQTDSDTVAKDVARAVLRAHREHEGDILAFLPGQNEISKAMDYLADALGQTHILPLYGMLPAEEQRRAIRPSLPGERKVVLATNIAETSLTIQGVRIVVDAGLQRSLVYTPHNGLSHLQTLPISLDMAQQRTGRAGRLERGVCYRLWSMAEEHRMKPFRTPELLEADLTALCLDVAAWGERDPERLPWLTPPPRRNVQEGQLLLQLLGALDSQGNITDMGRRMSAYPCHPRVARMMLGAESHEMKALAADIAALMEERDPMPQERRLDINLRIAYIRQLRCRHQEGRSRHLLQIATQYRQLLHVREDNADPHPLDTGLLLATAYPERVAKALDSVGHFRTASSRDVSIDREDDLAHEPWIAIAQMNALQGTVYMASPVDAVHLAALMQERRRVTWDMKQGMLVCQQEMAIGSLVVTSKPLQASRQEMVQQLCQAVQRYGESILDFNDAVQQLQRRVQAVAVWHPDLGLPSMEREDVLANAAEWLPFYLEGNGHLRTTAAELRKIDLAQALWGLLSYEQQAEVDRLAPTHVVVPSGSKIRIQYRQGTDAPVLSVRLQECFGLTDTPCVNGGRQPLLMELLSPGFKPVQLTQDLRNFWQETYFEVRKELKRRYPKHSWPENPLEAEATRGVKRTGK